MYSSVNYINEIVGYVLLVVSGGTGFTTLVLILKWVTADDEDIVITCKRNIKKCIIACISALCLNGLISTITGIITK